jgi:1-acyl-sn-glycerol-3-phosphate acyltransferase
MMAKLNYCWRLAITGLCFFGFSAGGALLSALVFPPLYIVTRDPVQRHQRAQWFIHKFFGLMVAVLRHSGTMRLELVGVEQLKDTGNALVLANHPTILDIVVLLSLMPRANCIVKSDFWSSPFIGGVVRTAGYINNSTPERLIDDCVHALHAGYPLVVFPEGTRSRPDRPLKFLRGAAHIALKSDMPIVPVLLHCDPPTLMKGSRWYEIPPRPFRLRVIVRPPLQAGALADPQRTSVIAARRLTRALEYYFRQELSAL